MHDEAWALIDDLQAQLKSAQRALRPVIAYFGEQWISDRVRKEYRELVQFAKGNGNE
jgi:hypothetical protein